MKIQVQTYDMDGKPAEAIDIETRREITIPTHGSVTIQIDDLFFNLTQSEWATLTVDDKPRTWATDDDS